MRSHLLTPEQALIRKQGHEVHRLAWKLRKATGGALRFGLLISVPEYLWPEVTAQVIKLQKLHKKVKA